MFIQKLESLTMVISREILRISEAYDTADEHFGEIFLVWVNTRRLLSSWFDVGAAQVGIIFRGPPFFRFKDSRHAAFSCSFEFLLSSDRGKIVVPGGVEDDAS